MQQTDHNLDIRELQLTIRLRRTYVDLGLRRTFPWRFVIADVTTPIIGLDFLAHYHLLPDVRQGCLVDGQTGLKSIGNIGRGEETSIKAMIRDNTFLRVLWSYPELTRQGSGPRHAHDTKHFIETRPGPPIAHRPRRLAPDKLKAAKLEFELLQQEGIIQPSKSPWAAPLHMVPKKDAM